MPHPTPCSTLFPYTTLFRSQQRVPPAALLHGLLQCSAEHAAAAHHDGQREHGERDPDQGQQDAALVHPQDRKSTRLNSSHVSISYAVFCLKNKKSPLRYMLQ